MNQLSRKAYELRKDILTMIYGAKAGHIGGDMSVIDILTTLYYSVMNVNKDNITDTNRDRFILSKGHCADALYVVLGDLGFVEKDEVIKTFSRFGSRYIGHPSMEVPGVEVNSGSLGHGIPVGVGMALAGKMDKKDYRVYIVLGDGEMAEGSNYEAMMAAAHYKLDNLCATIDCNGLQISGTTKEVMDSINFIHKFESFGWNVISVEDGNDCEQLEEAYSKAKEIKGKPTVVLANTVKGKGISYMENNKSWHHGTMSREQYDIAIKEIEEVLR